jgi:hypothetical protein
MRVLREIIAMASKLYGIADRGSSLIELRQPRKTYYRGNVGLGS